MRRPSASQPAWAGALPSSLRCGPDGLSRSAGRGALSRHPARPSLRGAARRGVHGSGLGASVGHPAGLGSDHSGMALPLRNRLAHHPFPLSPGASGLRLPGRFVAVSDRARPGHAGDAYFRWAFPLSARRSGRPMRPDSPTVASPACARPPGRLRPVFPPSQGLRSALPFVLCLAGLSGVGGNRGPMASRRNTARGTVRMSTVLYWRASGIWGDRASCGPQG